MRYISKFVIMNIWFRVPIKIDYRYLYDTIQKYLCICRTGVLMLMFAFTKFQLFCAPPIIRDRVGLGCRYVSNLTLYLIQGIHYSHSAVSKLLYKEEGWNVQWLYYDENDNIKEPLWLIQTVNIDKFYLLICFGHSTVAKLWQHHRRF